VPTAATVAAVCLNPRALIPQPPNLAGDLDMPPLLPKPSDCDKCHGKPRLEQRVDDTEAVVRDRLVIYNRDTSPLIDYYRKQGKLQDFAVKKGLDDMPRLLTELGIA
jgi:adenylate kinase family enzyme